jgi:hypothetical protein
MGRKMDVAQNGYAASSAVSLWHTSGVTSNARLRLGTLRSSQEGSGGRASELRANSHGEPEAHRTEAATEVASFSS